MIDLRLRQATLFGEEDVTEVSDGDLYLAKLLIGRWDDARARAEWFMNHLPLTGDMLVDEEDAAVLRGALESYVLGNFTATIILADSAIERVLANFTRARGWKKKAKSGLSEIAGYLRDQQLLESYVAERLIRLHEIRNNFVHVRPASSGGRLFHRAMHRRLPTEIIIAADAKEAVCLAHAIAARYPQSLPGMHDEPIELPKDVIA